MSELRRQEDSILGNIRKNWVIIVAAVTIVSTAAVQHSTVTTIEKDLKKNVEVDQSTHTAHDIRLTRNEDAIIDIRGDIKDIKVEQREQRHLLQEILRAVK